MRSRQDGEHAGVAARTARPAPEPAGILAVAANARLAMAGGGTYLIARTGPGTPEDLSDAIRRFADGLQDIAMNAGTGVRCFEFAWRLPGVPPWAA